MDGHVAGRPVAKRRRELGVGDEVDRVELVDISDAVDEVVEHGPLGERQEHLRGRVGERSQPRGVAGGEDEDVHSRADTSAERRDEIDTKSARSHRRTAIRWRRVAGGTLLPTRVGMW